MSEVLLLPSSIALGRTSENLGTPNTGVTAIEYGDARNHLTELVVSQLNALTPGDAGNLRDGYLLYTFPAGSIVLDYAYMSMALQSPSTEQNGDTPELGLGTVIATGVGTTLTGTAEDILNGAPRTADCNGTALVKLLMPNAQPFIILAAEPHVVHLNMADGWADDLGGDLDIDIDGTVTIAWKFLS